MATIAECPACRRTLQVPDELLGKLVKCPSCGETFTASDVPPAEPVSPVQPERPAPAAGPREPRRRREYEEDEGYHDDHDRPRRYPDRRSYGEPHRGAMILTLGILSIVICGLIGPFAWSMGNADLDKMRRGRMDREGEGLTTAGKICGIVGTVIGVLQLCYAGFMILMFAGAAAF